MKAIDKYMKKQARNNSTLWTNVLVGQCSISIDASEYKVSVSTMRQQARKDGFKTKIWGEEILIYR